MTVPPLSSGLILTVPSGKLTTDGFRLLNAIRSIIAGPLMAPIYTVATVPDATRSRGGIIYVSNEAGGATLAFSDGTSWRRAQDRVVIS
jgi:hypothetical protein